jgi:hypothetical protein
VSSAQQRAIGQPLQAAWEACNAATEFYQHNRARMAWREGLGGRKDGKYKLRTGGVETSVRGSQGHSRAATAFPPAAIQSTYHKYLFCISGKRRSSRTRPGGRIEDFRLSHRGDHQSDRPPECMWEVSCGLTHS